MKIILYILLFINFTTIQAQDIGNREYELYELGRINRDSIFSVSINPELPEFKFSVKIGSVRLIKNKLRYYINYDITISSPSLKNNIQQINDTTDLRLISETSIILADLNFDKYLDLSYSISSDIKGNSEYSVLLFNPDDSKFYYNEKYSEIINASSTINEPKNIITGILVKTIMMKVILISIKS
jgi:hypothetical protein